MVRLAARYNLDQPVLSFASSPVWLLLPVMRHNIHGYLLPDSFFFLWLLSILVLWLWRTTGLIFVCVCSTLPPGFLRQGQNHTSSVLVDLLRLVSCSCSDLCSAMSWARDQALPGVPAPPGGPAPAPSWWICSDLCSAMSLARNQALPGGSAPPGILLLLRFVQRQDQNLFHFETFF